MILKGGHSADSRCVYKGGKAIIFPQNGYIGLMRFLTKLQQDLKTYMRKIILKFTWEGKGSRRAKTILKRNKVGEFKFPTEG
mgnify:CR=1 FL=1